MQPKAVTYQYKELRESVERQLDDDPVVASKNIGTVAQLRAIKLSGRSL